MPRLTWEDGDTHEFVVIGEEGRKSHWNQKGERYVPCTGKATCWFCKHGYDYQGVVIGVAIYSPEEIEGTHFPWLSLTPNAYKAIRRILGVLKKWYGHKIALTRTGKSFDTRYTAEDLGKEKKVDLILWAKKREEELVFDQGETWGEEKPEEEEPPDEEVVMERAPEPEADKEGEVAAIKETMREAQERLEELKKGKKGRGEG